MCVCVCMCFRGKSPPPQKKYKNPPIKIDSAHIHIPRNNPAKFHNNPMDSLGRVADNRFRTDGTEGQGQLSMPRLTEVAGHKKLSFRIFSLKP